MQNKKGQMMGGIGSAVIGLLFLGIISAILIGAGLYAATTFQNKLGSEANASIAYNATGEMIEGVSDLPTWVTLVIIIGFVGLIISALIGWGLGKRGQAG